jgi:hypothetical protein
MSFADLSVGADMVGQCAFRRSAFPFEESTFFLGVVVSKARARRHRENDDARNQCALFDIVDRKELSTGAPSARHHRA